MRNAISPAEQLAVTLRLLATVETYTSLQYQFRINKGTLSLIIPRVCEAISTVLASYITCPSSEEEWLEIAKRFHSRWQLHPPGTGSDYFHYKGFFSIVLTAAVGPNAEFVFADVGCQGRISDGGVLRSQFLLCEILRWGHTGVF